MHTYIHVHINITYMLFISLGVFMRDVTLCNEGTPKKLRNGLYNFSKLRTLVMMVRFFIHIQLAYLSLYTYTSRPLSCPFLPHFCMCLTPFLSISSFFIPTLPFVLFYLLPICATPPSYQSPLSSYLSLPSVLFYLLPICAKPPFYLSSYLPFPSVLFYLLPICAKPPFYLHTYLPLCPFLPPSYICHTPFLSISSFFIPTPPLCHPLSSYT